ncbi:hypothetical protein M569_07856 [Genlisea aurea]|uniref:Plant synaptotagmin n=1 Tax=Genlisea aurea TaxID=192259 RepID=S8CQ17_9LAMI|nr:hypothetical protein M569_07856 [Genlisea aurea]
MGFAISWIVGAALGFCLMVGFARFQNTRSRMRHDLSSAIASLARMTVQDSKKLLPDRYYPSWLHWLNHLLDKIWPYVDQAASQLLRESVEPILEQYRPAILASLKFSTLTLGTVAPHFTGYDCVVIMVWHRIMTGVSVVQTDDPKEIVMELDIQWDGNPNIVLDIKTRVGVSLPIQVQLPICLLCSNRYRVSSEDGVKNIGFTGVFRLLLKPLVDEETIKDAIEDSITWPVRKIIPILPGDYSYLEIRPEGILEVKLIEAKELTNKDLIGKSDPFAKIFIRPLPDRTRISRTIDNQLNPVWNEHYEFEVEDASSQHLTVKIYDEEGVQGAELIGCAHFPLRQLQPGKVKDVWLKLVKDLKIRRDNKNRGQVHLELLYCPYDTESAFMNPFDPDFRLTSLEKAFKNVTEDFSKSTSQMKKDAIIVRGVLSATVVSAEGLPATDMTGKSDPFVVLTMKKSEQKNKTRVLNDTLNPVWNQTFDFVVEDGLHELLMMEVYDHDTFGKDKMGRCLMTLTRVILEGEFTDSFPIDGTESGNLTLHLKWTPQTIIKE